MTTIFNISNILASLILAASVINSMGLKPGAGFSTFLEEYRWIIGAVCLVSGIIFIFRPGYMVHDIVGIFAGLVLLSDRLGKVAGIGDHLSNFSKHLIPYQVVIGVAAFIVGAFGILHIGIFA